MIRRPPRSTLFPYTTLFRSLQPVEVEVAGQDLAQNCRCGHGTQNRDRVLCFKQAQHFLLDALARQALDLIDRKSTRLNSSHTVISYAVFCLKKKKKHNITY